VYGSYMAPFGTQIGLNQYVGSGTPLTTDVNTLQTTVFAEGRGDLGRTPMLSSTDLLVSHELRVGGDRRMRFELNVLNVFNQKTVRHRFNVLNRSRSASRINLANVNLTNGYDYRAMIAATPDGRNNNAIEPRNGMPDLWSEGAQGYAMVKFLF